MTQMFTVYSKSKKKPANTAKARQLAQEWEELKKKWEPKKPIVAPKNKISLEQPLFVRETKKLPSLGTGFGNATKAPEKVYTGTEMIGIGQLHKSNGVPIFRKQDAEDLAKMRR